MRSPFALAWRLWWLLALGIALASLAGGCGFSGPDIRGGEVRNPGAVVITPVGTGPALKVGSLAPDFTLPDLDGNPVSLRDFRGKVVLINFWGTWCPPCRAEMPDFKEVYEEFKPQGLEIIGVDLPPDTEEDVRLFTTRGGFTWVFLMDKGFQVARLYAIGAVPSTFFLDREGVIRDIRIGAMNVKEMRKRLSPLFSGG